MNLYEIDQTIADILDNGFSEDPETGEVLFDFSDLQQLEKDKSEKIENIALWIKDQESMANAIREEEKNLAERRKTLEKRADRLRRYLAGTVTKFSTPKVSVSSRNVQNVKINNESEIPDEYIKVVEMKKVSKTDIRNAIKSGIKVPGAELVSEKRAIIK